MKSILTTSLTALAAIAGIGGLAQTASAQDLVFLSTQLRPIEEAQKVRDVILKGAPKTAYVVDEPAPFTVRMKAETESGKRTVSVVGALHGELQPLVPMGALDTLDDLVPKLANRNIPAGLMELGKMGTGKQMYIPWMQATYVMVVNKKALHSFRPAPT